ncbi:acyl-CoA dehydrogenase [Sediminicola luteus]|uniref:Acyl-CoA dehydrogenase n=1 Tax=Sediminicola luteus TaxID=319238 RepID=A0A2A4GE56_9FLAO|nr:acyl-CoA dehydrogenase [Sediminicola luteus]PCE66032.1 acyl-CoA dehydrogenase [Sediminicola luteus]
MAEKYIELDDLRFILEEVLDLSPVIGHEKYQEYDLENIQMMLDSFKEFSDRELFPYSTEMDTKPVYFKEGQIYVHPHIEKVNAGLAEMGWFGAMFDYENHGIQMPMTVYRAIDLIMNAANNSAPGYALLTAGAAKLIITFGSQELQDTYVEKMANGEWMGSMCLTEPQAGSSLSDIKTSASDNGDGTYNIEGQKIFISGGDMQFTDNVIHLTLARIEGAPAGTKGISLFVVPKNRLTADGGLEYNDVQSIAEFEKVGQQGFATVHLGFGGKNDCKGWLVGEPGRGLQYMFQMMNGARIGTGVMGAGIASAAYQASLQYANERNQGRKLNKSGVKDATTEQISIMNHADVRRMLLLQRAVTEGSFALILECSRYFDLEHLAEGEAKHDYELIMELLTPIVKTYPAEQGQTSVSNGLQVLGGYGFTMDFPLQQYYRDIRIMSLYEGTTGIQSQDLLGRKMTMNKGRALKLFGKEVYAVINEAQGYEDLKGHANDLDEAFKTLEATLAHLFPNAAAGDFETFLADANVMMELFSTLVIGWQWLKMGVAAKKALNAGATKRPKAFYEGKLLTLRYFYKFEMPRIASCAVTLTNTDMLTIKGEGEELIL